MATKNDAKAALYDDMLKIIATWEPSIKRILGADWDIYRSSPTDALFVAFGRLVDENKRYELGDKRLLARIRAKL